MQEVEYYKAKFFNHNTVYILSVNKNGNFEFLSIDDKTPKYSTDTMNKISDIEKDKSIQYCYKISPKYLKLKSVPLK